MIDKIRGDDMKQKKKEEASESIKQEEVREVIVERQTGFNYFEVIIIMVISILFGFLVGNVIHFVAEEKGQEKVPQELEELVTTYEDIKENYYEKVDQEALLNAAIAGMIGYLDDPYSSYLDVASSEDFNRKVDGEYVGIGTSIGYQNNQIILMEVNKEGPAYKAGLKVGDVIVEIDGKDVTQMKFSEASELMKGEEGEVLQLTIVRNHEKKEYHIKRSKIEMQSVSSKTYENKKIGYLKIDIFAANTKKQFESELKKLEKEKIHSLIIDVRDNPGGHLTQASEILSMFLTKKQVMYQLDVKGKKEKVYALNNEKRTYPVVVLVNKNSASASEILASAFQEAYQATLIGTQTYGKGTVQKSISLKDGATVKFTTEKWYTSKGKWINEIGMEPNKVVEENQAFLESSKEEDDTQLQEAISILKKE